MPYPQFAFHPRDDTASQPLPSHQGRQATRSHSPYRVDPPELEAVQLQTSSSARKRALATTFTTLIDTNSTIVSLSPSPPRNQPIDTPRSSQPTETTLPSSGHPPRYTYKCTLCWKEHEPPCYTIGSEPRIVCLDCWRWIHSVSICWKCNEVVYRKEDAISFGWC